MKLAILSVLVLSVTASAQAPGFHAPHVRLGDSAVPNSPQPKVFRYVARWNYSTPPWTTNIITTPAITDDPGPRYEFIVTRTGGSLLTCDLSKDMERVHNCRIAEGHTLDEVMQAYMDLSGRERDEMDAERREWAGELNKISEFLRAIDRPATPKAAQRKKK